MERGNYQNARGLAIPIMKNKEKFIALIEKEIEKVNVQIDRKIANGKPYQHEAEKHHKLISLLAEYE